MLAKDTVDISLNIRSLEEEIYLDRIQKKSNLTTKPFRLIDLFCGAGGMSLGFSKSFGHNFKSVWANDYNKYCAETYNANFGEHCTFGDIVDIIEDASITIPQADVVIGGPPCQGFSLLNKNRDNDPRRQLWIPYLDIVNRSGAKVFIIENVPSLLGTPEHYDIVSTAESMGFQVWSGKLLAADYGVPQARWRAIIVGAKYADPGVLFPLRKTHYNPDLNSTKSNSKVNLIDFMPGVNPWKTVRDAISDLPAPVGTEIRDEKPPLNLHFGRTPTPLSIKRYRAIPNEGMNRVDLLKNAPDLTPECWKRKKSGGTDLFGRLWWARPAVTMRTEFFKPEKGRYLHPEQHRPITHREAARFQSFPDNFIFKGNKIEIAKQIGNAVPPVFAARIADAVTALLLSE
ncbi:MAG: DNA cytosine methyltransferase [Bacteroidia bacterium]|jgi:DNA (cytosine-5)-methyltransferase 1|nr:DNA cytosine methyltransferase [Bacteroidia bacterium]